MIVQAVVVASCLVSSCGGGGRQRPSEVVCTKVYEGCPGGALVLAAPSYSVVNKDGCRMAINLLENYNAGIAEVFADCVGTSDCTYVADCFDTLRASCPSVLVYGGPCDLRFRY
jgi:hypothetical protein